MTRLISRPASLRKKGLGGDFGVLFDQLEDPASGAHRVGQAEKKIAQGMAADPLAQHEDLSQGLHRWRHGQAHGVFDGPEAGHLVGARAQPADPRHQLRHILHPAVAHEAFEAPELLHHETGGLDAAVGDLDVDVGVALDPGGLFQQDFAAHRSLDRSLTMRFSKQKALPPVCRRMRRTARRLSSSSLVRRATMADINSSK